MQLYCCASVQYFQMTQQCLPQEEGLKKEMNTELLLPHTHRLGHVLCALHHDALGTPLSFFNMHTVQCNRISEIDTRLQAKKGSAGVVTVGYQVCQMLPKVCCKWKNCIFLMCALHR